MKLSERRDITHERQHREGGFHPFSRSSRGNQGPHAPVRRRRTQKLRHLPGRALCRKTTKTQTTCSSDEGRKDTKRREGRSRNHIHIYRPPRHAEHTQRVGRENNRTKHDMLDIFINKLRLGKAVTDGFQGGGRRQKQNNETLAATPIDHCPTS